MADMEVEGVGLAQAATIDTSNNSRERASVDYDTFLQLLIAQIESQDPLNPMDSTEFVAQLATFSQVEQAIQINSKLDSILANSMISQSEALIGRTVTSADGLVSGEVASVHIMNGNLEAVLVDGREVAIGTGIVIS